MVELGYKLASEEHRSNDLVEHAKMAEDAGFGLAMISDHFHPWTDREGQSPFVWAVLGGIARATKRLRIGTSVTCPTMRIHPAIIAQAAATVADMFEGRFFLGVGSGENLNEHILGEGWPEPRVRLAMLEEAIDLIRRLWTGELTSHDGSFYTVEGARIFTRPAEPPPLYVAGDHEKSAELAGRLGDGLLCASANEGSVKTFEASGGEGKAKIAEMTVCWADDEEKARAMAKEIWPIAGMTGPLTQELKLPSHFEAVAAMVTEEAIGENVVCGPDPERHLEKIREFVEAGYDSVVVHQIGPDQRGFFRFYEREVRPLLGQVRKAA
jgi:coenzyme F420-dependent glucose-6-phosphate dehydrogenase